MNVLELFAGSRSIGKEAEKQGHKVFSVDINAFDGIDLVQDIEFLTLDMIPFKPNMIFGKQSGVIESPGSFVRAARFSPPRRVAADVAKRISLVARRLGQTADPVGLA